MPRNNNKRYRFRNFNITINLNKTPKDIESRELAQEAFDTAMREINRNIKDYVIMRKSRGSDPSIPYPHKDKITSHESKWNFEQGDKYGKLHLHWSLFLTIDGPPPDANDPRSQSAFLDYKQIKNDLEDLMGIKGIAIYGYLNQSKGGLHKEQTKLYNEKSTTQQSSSQDGPLYPRQRNPPSTRGGRGGRGRS